MATDLPLAVQLYTLRRLSADLDALLKTVAEAGYRAVETVGAHGLSAAAMKSILEAHEVEVVSSHVALDALEADLEHEVRFALAVGNDTLVVPWLPESRRPTDAEGWKELGAHLGRLGGRCAQQGVRLLYHNHDFEMNVVDGAPALAWLADAASEADLGFELDLAWIVRGGQDPTAWLERLKGRCPRLHVKDLAARGTAEDEDGWADVGAGVLDWEHLLRVAHAVGVEWYVVEHDAPQAPAESIRNSREFLETMPAIRATQR